MIYFAKDILISHFNSNVGLATLDRPIIEEKFCIAKKSNVAGCKKKVIKEKVHQHPIEIH